MERIEDGDLLGGQPEETRSDGIVLVTKPCNASTRTRACVGSSVGIWCALVQNYAIAQRGGRNIAHHALLLSQAGSFVVVEEKEPILKDLPAYCSPKDVAD